MRLAILTLPAGRHARGGAAVSAAGLVFLLIAKLLRRA
jgi:hypothetical protein